MRISSLLAALIIFYTSCPLCFFVSVVASLRNKGATKDEGAKGHDDFGLASNPQGSEGDLLL